MNNQTRFEEYSERMVSDKSFGDITNQVEKWLDATDLGKSIVLAFIKLQWFHGSAELGTGMHTEIKVTDVAKDLKISKHQVAGALGKLIEGDIMHTFDELFTTEDLQITDEMVKWLGLDV